MNTILFDGNNLAYRANSVTDLTTKDGRRTSAILGVINSIPYAVNEVQEQLDYTIGEIVVFWDYGKNKRRLKLYPEYKASRKHDKTDDDRVWYEEFIEQTEVLHKSLPLLGVKSIKVSSQEADDLIHTFITVARQERDDEDNKFSIISTDEDYLQLVDGDVAVYSPIKKIMYTDGTFQDLVGLAPEQFISFKILKGDSSDNIPGIHGIGDVTGKKLVSQYGNLSGILAHAADPDLRKSKVNSRIFTKEGLEILDRNNKLMNLKDYVDIEETKAEMIQAMLEQPSVSDKEVREFLMEYQLSSILVKYKEWIRVYKSANVAYYD